MDNVLKAFSLKRDSFLNIIHTLRGRGNLKEMGNVHPNVKCFTGDKAVTHPSWMGFEKKKNWCLHSTDIFLENEQSAAVTTVNPWLSLVDSLSYCEDAGHPKFKKV